MPRMRTYRELVAWQKAMDLVVTVYRLTQDWPREELYGLTAQIRRAAVSVPSNVAEGQGRSSQREFVNHLSIAYGSLMELETQISIAERIGYVDQVRSRIALQEAGEVGRLINGLSSAIREDLNTDC